VGHRLLVAAHGSRLEGDGSGAGLGGGGPGATTVTVTRVTSVAGTRYMRDLTVAEIHTYYVLAGTTPVLVHNFDCGPPTEVDARLARDRAEELQSLRTDYPHAA